MTSTERKQAEEIQHEQTRDIAALEERQRLARELHDGVSQSLSAALVIAGVLPRIWKIYPDKGQERVDMLISALREAATEMRTLLIELQPSALEQAEIGELLKQLTVSISKRAEVPIELEVNGKRQLSPDMQIALYRITQEALNNAARHADASQMRVSLHRSPTGKWNCALAIMELASTQPTDRRGISGWAICTSGPRPLVPDLTLSARLDRVLR